MRELRTSGSVGAPSEQSLGATRPSPDFNPEHASHASHAGHVAAATRRVPEEPYEPWWKRDYASLGYSVS